MIGKEDLAALVELLNRAPKSIAEALWAQGFIERLGALARPETDNFERTQAEALAAVKAARGYPED